MEMWYTEEQTKNVRFSIRCDKQKYSAQSDFQRIEIFSTPEFGDVLVLDDRIMLTTKDEFIYHEMITHVPMATNPNIKNVLVIGAGDGGTVKELTRYKTIEQIDMVEIDRMVVDACKEYLPTVALMTVCVLSEVLKINMTSLLLILLTRLVRVKACLQQNFTATATRL